MPEFRVGIDRIVREHYIVKAATPQAAEKIMLDVFEQKLPREELDKLPELWEYLEEDEIECYGLDNIKYEPDEEDDTGAS